MVETLALRILALFSLVLAVGVAWLAAAAVGESWQRLAARVALAALLLWLARLAWRRPLGRPGRLRRRVLRLLAVLAHPEAQREWAESSPSTDLAEALLADWRAAVHVADSELAAAFSSAELAEVLALRADLATLATGLPRGEGAAGTPAWAPIVARARRTHDAFVARRSDETA